MRAVCVCVEGVGEALTRGGEEGSRQVMGVGEPGEHPLARGSTEQVQLPVHVQLVGIQVHLLSYGEKQIGGGGKRPRER